MWGQPSSCWTGYLPWQVAHALVPVQSVGTREHDYDTLTQELCTISLQGNSSNNILPRSSYHPRCFSKKPGGIIMATTCDHFHSGIDLCMVSQYIHNYCAHTLYNRAYNLVTAELNRCIYYFYNHDVITCNTLKVYTINVSVITGGILHR
jgi:hypothetical protein